MKTINQSDTDIWEAFLRKEPVAERIVFDELFYSLCFYTERITQHKAQAEDIVTESMIAAFNIRNQFAAKENIKRYLYRSVYNASVNYLSQLKTRSDIHEKIKYLQQGESADNPLTTEIMRAEVIQAIYQEIEGLPDQCRKIFTMIFLEGRSNKDIAEELHINVQTVRSQKARAIELLRTRLLKLGKLEAFMIILVWLVSLHSPQYEEIVNSGNLFG
ncbi:sigma-70 family RNA polymerase sigma factor [Chitinophagaceae bacterium 26-R-25]|nr:sigma-70 family RNA polymerase sigma factor [Chitinophagaceae bacterium 26-R-25]